MTEPNAASREARAIAARLTVAADQERDHACEQDFWHEDLMREAAVSLLALADEAASQSREWVEAMRQAMLYDPFCDDERLVGTSQQEARCHHYAAAAARALHDTAPTDQAQGGEVERLQDLLDIERYRVAIALQDIKRAIGGRCWLAEGGRGSYTYDDERYQQEFGHALDEIDAAMKPLQAIARDWSDCPRDPLRVAANRSAALAQSGEPS